MIDVGNQYGARVRGTGVYWERYEKVGFNPVTGSAVPAERRRIKRDEALPVGQDYDEFILARLDPGV